MKRVSAVLFGVLCLAATASTMSAQQGIYMFSDAFKGDQGAPHMAEFKLNSASVGSTNSVTISSATTGAGIGKPSFSTAKLSMRLHPPTFGAFNKTLMMGTLVPSIEIRHYNSTGKVFYKTVFENAYLTNVSTEGSDETSEVIEFVYVRVRWFATPDAAGLQPLVQTGCWDVTLNRTC